MRNHLFLLVLTLVSAFALVGCIKNAPVPTGDAEKDGKAFADYVVSKALKVNSVEDYDAFVEEIDKCEQQFKDYYEAKGSDAEEKISRYVDYYTTYHPKYEEAKKNLDKIREKKSLEEDD